MAGEQTAMATGTETGGTTQSTEAAKTTETVVIPTETKTIAGEASGTTAETKPAEEGKAAEKATPALFDPKAYKAPEGATVDEKLLGDYATIVNDDKLTGQERGNKLLDLYNSAMKQVGESHTKAWSDTNAKWIDEVKADPEIGGAKIEATKATISKAIDSLGPEMAKAFRQSLDITGVGNNPAFIRGMAKLASALTEGSHVSGNPPAGKDKPVSEIFFPNSPEMKE